MKKLLALVALITGCASLQAQAQHKLTSIWLTTDLPTPESVLFVADKKSPYLLVSLIDGDGSAADGKGGIAKLAPDGTVIEKDWVAGMNAPKGMGIVQDNLYVADLADVVVINIKTKKIIKRIPIDGAVFLNDVAASASGVVYVSDTRTNKIHRIENDKPSVYLENVVNANGLQVIGSDLVVGAGPELLSFGVDKKPQTLAKGFAQGIDGVEMTQRGEFIVSCWPGLIYYVYADGKIQLLVDSQADKINTADIGFDPATKTLFVPNFLKNSVTAYRLE